MNWQEISTTYPNAFRSFSEWELVKYYDTRPSHFVFLPFLERNDFNPRDLYDFFDSRHIHLWVVPHVGTETWWMGQLWTLDNGLKENLSVSQVRTDSEHELFTRAFEMLELTANHPQQ